MKKGCHIVFTTIIRADLNEPRCVELGYIHRPSLPPPTASPQTIHACNTP